MTFVRYVGIQLLAYIVDMGGFLIVLRLALFGPVVANVIGKIAALCFAFVAHRNFTFGVHERGDRRSQAIRYFSLAALNVPLSSAVLAGVLLGVDQAALAKILADVICVVFTYSVSKRLVFVGSD